MNIFVAKLSFDTQSEDLREVFQSFGEVTSAKVIMDKYTGRSDDGIVGGSTFSGLPAVGMLVKNGYPFCTATVIGLV